MKSDAEMLKYQSADEPEIFTTSYGDEMRLFEFIAAQKAYDHTT